MATVFMLHWFLMIHFQNILGHVFFYIRLPMICLRLRLSLNELNIAYRKSLARLPILTFVLYCCSKHPERNRLSPEHSPQCPTAGKILYLIVFLTMSYAQKIQSNLTWIINKHVGFIWSRIRFLFVLRAKHCAVWSMNTTYWSHEYSNNKLTWQSCSREKKKYYYASTFICFRELWVMLKYMVSQVSRSGVNVTQRIIMLILRCSLSFTTISGFTYIDVWHYVTEAFNFRV